MAKEVHLSMPLYVLLWACLIHNFGQCWSHWSCGLSSSMAIAMRASTCQKQWGECFIRSCHLSVYILQSTWCARPVCSEVEPLCDRSAGLLQLARPTVPVMCICMCTLCNTLCMAWGCTMHGQSRSDNSHVQTTAQTMFYMCARSGCRQCCALV